ncbi:D-sedoheptulose 7-phosphate isomerase [bacterium]|jgi:D-sedoheptulose 7-phosphate isomerase|nr:D-sedoheptulose 7-phosphate isomerase [bacterium]
MKSQIEAQIKASIEAKQAIPVEAVEIAAKVIISAYQSGNKLLIAGNGGSAADAQHIAAELVGRYLKNRDPLPAIALTTDTSGITAISNDFGYDLVFERQLHGLGVRGDVFLAISTSGQSTNLINAIKKAKDMGIHVVTLTGKDGGEMAKLADTSICVAVPDTPRIQEAHIVIYHIWCDMIEQQLFP